jgi:RNA polymerase sigma-70 factor (ECF subfamily)
MDSAGPASPRKVDRDFARTRWSMIAAVCDASEIDVRDTLRELCRRYWVPVYCYIRHSGFEPNKSARLVQHFFGRIVARLRIEKTDIAMGFRAFLESQLELFLSGDCDTLAATAPPPNAALEAPRRLDLIEDRLPAPSTTALSPSQAFHRAFAFELLANALDLLQQEAEESGRGELFNAVRPFLSREPSDDDKEALASTMQSSQLAAIIAVKRLRQRFQELIDSELARTVGDPRSLDSEKHSLLTLVQSNRDD